MHKKFFLMTATRLALAAGPSLTVAQESGGRGGDDRHCGKMLQRMTHSQSPAITTPG